jgi:hypothetical protein
MTFCVGTFEITVNSPALPLIVIGWLTVPTAVTAKREVKV